ncbi:MAG: hypothetical protein ACFCU6_00790 [Balneolaceae bacterium]
MPNSRQDDTFHVLVRKRKKPNEEWLPRFIDVYDFQNGDYLYSYHLPVASNAYVDFTIHNEYFIALNKTDLPEIVIWKIVQGWNHQMNQSKSKIFQLWITGLALLLFSSWKARKTGS